MRKIILYILVLILIISISSCKVFLRNAEMLRTDNNYPYLIDTLKPQKESKIAPFDDLTIEVSTNDGWSSTGTSVNTKVEYDGLVKLPILGRLNVTGYTIRELENLLEEKYSKYFQKPFINVAISNRKVYIFKGGTSASSITISNDNFTLLDAIVSSGGLSVESKSYKIKVIRGDVTNNPQVFIYDIYKLQDLNHKNLLLEANDIIYIETKPKYVFKIMTEISPYLSLFTTILLLISYSKLLK